MPCVATVSFNWVSRPAMTAIRLMMMIVGMIAKRQPAATALLMKAKVAMTAIGPMMMIVGTTAKRQPAATALSIEMSPVTTAIATTEMAA